MQTSHAILLLLQLLTSPALCQDANTTAPTTLISVSTASINTTLPLATPGALAPESQCSGNSSLLNFCPACAASMIPYGALGSYAVTCDSIYTNVRYYRDIHQANVFQCIEACQDLRDCYAPVVSPDGTCLLAVVEPEIKPTVALGIGYAVLEARSFSNTTSSIQTASSMEPEGGAPPWMTYSSPASTTTTTAVQSPTCQASEISCPRCGGAHIKDPFGKLHEVLCDTQVRSEKYYSIQEWLTPAGCMAECDKYDWCKGSNFWPDGNCELARSEDAYPVSRSGYTAFVSVDVRTPTPPLLALQTSSQPAMSTAEQTSSAYPAAQSSVPKCDYRHIKCPACHDVQLTDGLRRTYCIRCDLQPICAVMEGRHEHDTPNSCMEQCDEEPGCQAAIFEQGRCAVCLGTIESFTPWVFPHEYAVFIADEVLKNVSGSSLSPSSTSPPMHGS